MPISIPTKEPGDVKAPGIGGGPSVPAPPAAYTPPAPVNNYPVPGQSDGGSGISGGLKDADKRGAPAPAPLDPVAQLAGPETAGGGIQAQGVGTGYLNLQNVLRANLPQAKSMAQGLMDQAHTYGDAAEKSVGDVRRNGTDPNAAGLLPDVIKAQNFSRNLGTQGGLAVDLQDTYGKNTYGYNSAQAGMDSFLANAAGGQQFQAAQNNYGDLLGRLYSQPQQAPAPTSAQVKAKAPAPGTATSPAVGSAAGSGLATKPVQGLAPEKAEKPVRAGNIKNSY